MTDPCGWCDGTGKHYADQPWPCPHCNGKGYPSSLVVTRSTVPVLWAFFMLILFGVALWLAEPVTCVSSMLVEQGQAPITNPMSCQ